MIGFVILSHNNPGQLRRLVRTLSAMFDHPPIACHHDTSQSALNPSAFPANVTFVVPPVRTGWGKWSLVEAALRALALLYERADPDWFVLLSAADYPILAADRMLADLAATKVDALIDFREVGEAPESAARRFGPRNPRLGHFDAPANRKMIRGRYLGAELWLPMVRWNDAGRGPRLGRHTIHLPFDSPRHPFTADFRCYNGDQWFTGGRRAAQALLHPDEREQALRRYYYRRAIPDESYYQSVLCNRPGLTLARDTRRFVEWDGGGAHPRTLTLRDAEAMLASGAHFARKFKPDDPVLDRIDEALLGAAARAG